MMESHERIEELLAGYALRSLSGEDAKEADRLLAEHVPTCSRCREELRGFLHVSGDLALATNPAAPPDLLRARLRRATVGEPVLRRRRSLVMWSAAATIVAAVIGLGSWNTLLNNRLNDNEDRQTALSGVLTAFAEPDSTRLTLDGQTEQPSHMDAAYFPGENRVYLFGTSIPQPSDGNVYRLWLIGTSQDVWLIDFRPEDTGLVILFVNRADPARFSRLVITEEPEGSGSGSGSPSGTERWAAEL